MMSKKNYKTPESVLVVIYTSQLEILLIERADFPNFWQSVTGSLEQNETTEHTAIREVFEETHLDILKMPHLFKLKNCNYKTSYEIYHQFRYKYHPEVTHNTEHLFILEINESLKSLIQINPNEHTQWQWFSLQDAIIKVKSPSNRQALENLINYINN